MSHRTRRELMADVGTGMFAAALGPALTADLGLSTARADDDPGHLTFGDLDPLVAFVHETPADKLLPLAVGKLAAGTPLKTLVAAAALANARAFGGEDYVGFHTMMALAPALHMAGEEADPRRRPLAVLKVLFRNATRLGEVGGTKAEVLRPVRPDGEAFAAERVRAAARKADIEAAERAFAGAAGRPGTEPLDALMLTVDDATEVHRVVLVSRAWEMLDVVGRDRVHTLLRQSVRYCANAEKSPGYVNHNRGVRELLPKLLDTLDGRPAGTRSADDAWVSAFADTLFRATPAAAAEAAAAALAEGIAPGAIGEAIALAANQLVLRDEGRPAAQAQPNKPVGSCHGDSIGVHASDSANAWRTLARVGGRRTAASSLILGAYQVAADRGNRGGDFAKWGAYPRGEHRDAVRGVPADALLKELGGAIRDKDQGRAAALAARLGDSKADAKDVFAVLRAFAVSEDGALHAEKYYRTAADEYAAARPAFRWRQVVALARVSASACGHPAPGYKQACELMKV